VTTIHVRYVLRLLSLLILLMSASMAVSVGWSIYEYVYASSPWRVGSEVITALLTSMGIGAVVGSVLFFFTRKAPGRLGAREALALVSSAWFLGAAIAALPFWFWAINHDFLPGQDLAFLSFISCYFEAMSGLTTTGATVLKNIATIPPGLLFWRSYTHWLGGLGIVVIFVAVLPGMGASGKRLFRFETSGISQDGITPNIQDQARILMFIYFGFTIAEVLLLKLVDSDITWFNALTHTFATLATGGFSTTNASAGGFSPAVQWVMIGFMVLAGINFGLYQRLYSGRFQQVFQNNELRFYLALLFVSAIIIALSISTTSYHTTSGELATLSTVDVIRDAVFQTVSIQTTTGFTTVNFEEWGLLPKAVLIGLMFVGGCGGSTSGGIKVIRILACIKVMWNELERAFRPSVVRPVRIGTHTMDTSQRLSVLSYVLGILFLFGLGTVLLMLTEAGIDGTTALTASIAALNNIGPGLARVGAIENYSWFSDTGKLLLCILMAIGRLEVFAVIVVFMPRFWRTQ